MYEFLNPSPQALAAADNLSNRKTKYPWASVPQGKSFAIPKSAMKWTTLKPYAIKMGKKYNRSFVVIEHEEYWEVSCVKHESKFYSVDGKELMK